MYGKIERHSRAEGITGLDNETLRFVSDMLLNRNVSSSSSSPSERNYKIPEESAGVTKTENLRFQKRPENSKRIATEAVADTSVLRDLLRHHEKEMKIPAFPKIVQKDVSSLLTVIVSTSATQSNPSTLLPEVVLSSFFQYAPCLRRCRKIIVCDGYRKPKKKNRDEYRKGCLTDETARRYEEYIKRLVSLAHEEIEPVGRNAKVLVMPERRGFGYALKAGLHFVKTPYVIVVQHDRMFSRLVNIPAVLESMRRFPEKLKYVHFPTSISQRFLNELKDQEFSGTNEWMQDLYMDIQRQTVQDNGASFVPIMHWYDSIHIASTKHYMDFVFGYDYAYQRMRVKFGSFPEDKIGQQLRDEIKLHGIKAHAAYGTFVYNDGISDVSVQHIDGRSFYSMTRRMEIKKKLGRWGQLSPKNFVALSKLAEIRGTKAE